jgi:hypothetical protein
MPLRYIMMAQQSLGEAMGLLRQAETMRSPYAAGRRFQHEAPPSMAAERLAKVAVLALKKAQKHTQAAIIRLNGEGVEESNGY